MFNIIIWLISSLFTWVWWSLHKKAVDSSQLSATLFSLFGPITWIILIYWILFIIGIDSKIFSDYFALWLLLLAWIIDGTAVVSENVLLKKVKISKVLPYSSFDKLFVILIGFILFYWNPWYESITTLLISILTVLIVVGFSMDLKKFHFEKVILQYIWVKLLYAIETILIWKVILDYSTFEVFSFIILVYLFFNITLNIFLKQNFKTLFFQSKNYYKYRLSSSILLWLSFIIWIFIIESAGVLVASLLSFITIVFSIASMKFLLWDSPSKKQIVLATLVILLIWIWYYFK